MSDTQPIATAETDASAMDVSDDIHANGDAHDTESDASSVCGDKTAKRAAGRAGGRSSAGKAKPAKVRLIRTAFDTLLTTRLNERWRELRKRNKHLSKGKSPRACSLSNGVKVKLARAITHEVKRLLADSLVYTKLNGVQRVTVTYEKLQEKIGDAMNRPLPIDI